MVRRIEISHLKRKSILSARWPQLGPGLIMGTFHRSARMRNEVSLCVESGDGCDQSYRTFTSIFSTYRVSKK